jgi:peroxiredoxin
LCARQDEFAKLNARVYIISFSTLPAIQQWMKEVCSTFTVLLDRDRVAYKAYQLERSRLRSWHPRVLWIYIKRWFQGSEFYASHGDDTSQLGGDFIVDKQGVLRLVHPSHDPSDRPAVDELLRVLRQIEHGPRQ